jgi:hypothetical protein
MMRLLAGFAGLAALAAATSAGTATQATGLRGLVTRGPIVPACRAGEACDGPARDVTLAFARNGRVVRRTTTDDNGRYRVVLAPGVYSVRLSVGTKAGPDLTPSRASVVARRVRRVDFSYDTGIR